MYVDNPEVTMDIEGHGIPSDAREAAFLDWLCSFVADGDDGKRYWFGCSPLVLVAEQVDLWHYEVTTETGGLKQIPGSVFKAADFPDVGLTGQEVHPAGSLDIDASDEAVVVTLGENFRVEIAPDHTWHYTLRDPENDFTADFVHHGVGFPTWYGREKPSELTQHSIAYGYNWSGRIEGTLTFGDKTVQVTGKGVRERYIAVDSSAAEIGGWEDWMWFHFDEAYGSLYEMKLGTKDQSLNLAEGNEFFPTGEFEIRHGDWAYLPSLGAFIPGEYRVILKVEAGVLDFTARPLGASVWGVTGATPSTPVATLNWDTPTGTFTYNDGRVVELTNGKGGVSIRQWQPYPNVVSPQFGAGQSDGLTRLATL
ncbi:MAG: hypothetical protein QM673_00530 [Gordonia sp. (in: high G+C Gram-positive bacteria)]